MLLSIDLEHLGLAQPCEPPAGAPRGERGDPTPTHGARKAQLAVAVHDVEGGVGVAAPLEVERLRVLAVGEAAAVAGRGVELLGGEGHALSLRQGPRTR